MFKELLITAAVLSTQATQPPQRCVSRQQTADLVIVALPGMIDGAARRCEPHLARDAFLRTGGAEMSQRLRSEGPTRTASAMEGIRAISGEPIPQGATPQLMMGMMEAMMTQRFVAGLDQQGCRNLDQLLAALAPLPANNIGQLVASIFAMATTGRGGEDSPPVCPA